MATKGTVSGVIANMVTLVVDGPVAQNEICYISTGGDRLMAEVIKVVGTQVYVQVFESTRGLKVGAEAEFTGHMLEVTLGPGMLSKNYDGLQNDLDKMDGVFLKRGQYTYPLDKESKWHFVPLAKAGDQVEAAAWLGQVDENFQPLKIMVPFGQKGVCTVKSIVKEGDYGIEDTIAVLTDEEGNDVKVNMIQKWPVKRAMTNYKEKPRPFKLLETGVRVIDTVNPIVEGGTGFIPGPFGTGKTVLQHAISKQAEADIVIIAACGERANEVVEIFTEFPELVDPHTGRKLMERTIIIANTSNMPVAAREASVYTAMTIAEYYRSMGLKVLLMADSTSRWAQALREMSNRMEELPGPDAFPMDLSSIISNFYGRAGYVKLNNGETGSITFIGTVSPAGGNLKEPVTENTKKDTIAVLTDEEGNDVKVNMIQKWPVKRAMTNYKEKPRPFKLLETGVRVIDTVNPIVEGGTGFIPGPFGTGKTVLQHAISKQAEADIVIIAACGERANEVVEIFTEFPELVDPHTGRKLMERTIIIANTSNMPVAAREASVYTAMTIAEYYRSMGLKVLLMADSTSRWAQALREMSNRMEELPGPDAFPMDLSSIISNFYGRAGYVKLNNGETGSITFIGTVSPAGGNLKEPVTENTKKVARCFYALEQDRADKKRYPAVNPIDSYSKYIEYPEFEDYITKRINGEWIGKVNEVKTRLQRGKEIAEQINILGDDGVPVEYHVTFWKSELIDFVILQQDAFDEIDAVTPMERQEEILNMVIDICHTEFEFDNFNEVMDYFKKMINICKQMNYSKFKSEEYDNFYKQLQELIEERKA